VTVFSRNPYINPPAKDDRDARTVLLAIERECIAFQKIGSSSRIGFACPCAFALAQGRGVYICPNILTRLTGEEPA
jgi:hypothetical protein